MATFVFEDRGAFHVACADWASRLLADDGILVAPEDEALIGAVAYTCEGITARSIMVVGLEPECFADVLEDVLKLYKAELSHFGS